VGAVVDLDTTGVSSFPFFSAGEPTVKVVIGSKAQPVDVVVGANIAAVLGNLAYKDTTVEVLGKDKLGSSATGGVLSEKKVVLAVTTPGVNPSTAYEMKTYVNDDLDNNTETTRDTITTPSLKFGLDVSSFNSSNPGPKIITKDLTSIISPATGLSSDGKINFNSGSSSVTTTEEEKVYAYATVYYDTGSAFKKVRAKNIKTGYEVVFTDPIPLCLDTSKTYAECSGTLLESDQLRKNNVEITFLGDKWTIFDYSVNDSLANPIKISSVTLGKQVSGQQTFAVGQSVTTPDGFVVTLTDISAFTPQKAQVDVTGPDGKFIKTIYLQDGNSQKIDKANNLVIKANNVFPGAFKNTGTADLSLYSSKLDITTGSEVSGGEKHRSWIGKVVSATVGSVPGISKIQLYNDDDQTYRTEGATRVLDKDESLNIIDRMPGYQLHFLGLDNVEKDSLQFFVTTGLPFSNGTGQVTGDMLRIRSGITNALTSNKKQEAMVVLATSDGPWITAGQVYYKDTTSSTIKWLIDGSNTIPYYYGNDEYANIYVNTTANTSNVVRTLIGIPELTEENAGSSATVGANRVILLQYDNTLKQFVDTVGTTTIGKFGYTTKAEYASNLGNVLATEIANDAGFVTDRGTVLSSISATDANIQYAKKTARGRFTLTKATEGDVAGSDGMESKLTMNEGDSKDIGSGYMVKVDSVTAKITGGAAGDITGLEELKPSVEKAAVVTALNTADKPLVVLDSDTSSANMIVVGGQIVNSVASAAGVSLKAGDAPMVKVMGSTKLIVAGYTAADTTEAGNALIKWLNENRDAVRNG
jgi:hypothetical protein